LTLAPNAPAAKRTTTSAPYACVCPAKTIAPPAAARPSAITTRSLSRSARRPQARSVSSMPKLTAPSTTPVSPSESPYSERSAGARAGRPTEMAEKLAWANVPAPRITHR
jgi:hypothetical protein